MAEQEIYVGATFSSFVNIKKAIDRYQSEEKVQLYISDSRTLQGNPKRIPKLAKAAPARLNYYSLTYSCVHGGRKFRSAGKGLRPNKCKSVRRGCPAHVHFRLDHTYKRLLVTSLREEHNHEIPRAALELRQGCSRMENQEEYLILQQVCGRKK